MRIYQLLLVLAFVGCAGGCSTDNTPATYGLKERPYGIEGNISDQNLDAIEVLMTQIAHEPIFDVHVHSRHTPGLTDVRCGTVEHGGAGGDIYFIKKSHGNWVYTGRKGVWGMVFCTADDIFGPQPADALDAINAHRPDESAQRDSK